MKKLFATKSKMIMFICAIVAISTLGYVLMRGIDDSLTGSFAISPRLLNINLPLFQTPTPQAVVNQALPADIFGVTLSWSSVAWASRYRYEMERFVQNGNWNALPASVFKAAVDTSVFVDFSEVGNRGYFRWRVWGVNNEGNNGVKTNWQYFSIGQASSTPPGFVMQVERAVAPPAEDRPVPQDPTPEYPCIDSDSQYGGNSKNYRGAVRWLNEGSVRTYEDRCTDATHIQEQTCYQGRRSVETSPCDRCLDGRCVVLPDLPLPTEQHPCIDSDSQYASPVYRRGTVRWLNEGDIRTYQDRCVDERRIEEQKCVDGGRRWSTETLPCGGGGCSNGSCVSSPPPQEPTPDSPCVDPDGEYQITQQFPFKTTVLWLDGGEVRRYEDHCLDSRRISEQTCYRGRASQSTFNCADSCLDGRCIQNAGR